MTVFGGPGLHGDIPRRGAAVAAGAREKHGVVAAVAGVALEDGAHAGLSAVRAAGVHSAEGEGAGGGGMFLFACVLRRTREE